MNTETLISLGYYVSSLCFLVATVMTAVSAGKFGKSALGSIFSYLSIGTGIFFVITIFQKIGVGTLGIDFESMDIWWHLMFYLALLSYFFGFKALVNLGNADGQNQTAVGAEKKWGLFALVVLIVIFIIPKWADPVVKAYSSSHLAELGLHHFLAFILAGWVGSYLLVAKKNLGQIGQAIADPMVTAVWALTLQHLWELLYESWKVVEISDAAGEGVEKIFLVIAGVAVTYAGLRLKSFATRV